VTVSELPVGVENDEILSLSVYPNPADNTATIRGLSHGQVLTVLAIDGKLMMESTVASESVRRLDVSDWPKGTYVIRVVDGRQGSVHHVRLVVM